MSENTQTTSAAPAAAPASAEPSAAKTFTQEEVDAIAGKRLAKAMKGMPTEEELTRFRSWESTQRDTENTIAALTRERDSAAGRVKALEAELTELKQKGYVASKGFTGEDAEFVAFKAAKLVNEKTTFEQAVDQIAQERSEKPSFDWSAPVGGGENKSGTADIMNKLIRAAAK